MVKTGRAVIVEESPKRGGIGAEIGATLAEEMAEHLLAPIKRRGRFAPEKAEEDSSCQK